MSFIEFTAIKYGEYSEAALNGTQKVYIFFNIFTLKK